MFYCMFYFTCDRSLILENILDAYRCSTEDINVCLLLHLFCDVSHVTPLLLLLLLLFTQV